MAAPVNAQKHVYDGVKFDSGLEVFCYKQLKASGIAFEYNTMSFVEEVIIWIGLEILKGRLLFSILT